MKHKVTAYPHLPHKRTIKFELLNVVKQISHLPSESMQPFNSYEFSWQAEATY